MSLLCLAVSKPSKYICSEKSFGSKTQRDENNLSGGKIVFLCNFVEICIHTKGCEQKECSKESGVDKLWHFCIVRVGNRTEKVADHYHPGKEDADTRQCKKDFLHRHERHALFLLYLHSRCTCFILGKQLYKQAHENANKMTKKYQKPDVYIAYATENRDCPGHHRCADAVFDPPQGVALNVEDPHFCKVRMLHAEEKGDDVIEACKGRKEWNQPNWIGRLEHFLRGFGVVCAIASF